MRRSVAVMLCLSLPASALAAPDLVGRWSSALDGLVLSIHDDGTFGITPPDRPALNGAWWVDPDSALHVFVNDPDSAVCPGIEGRYRLVTDDAQGILRFAQVDDSCYPRMTHMESAFTRID